MPDGIKIKADFSSLAGRITEKLTAILNPEVLLRPIAFDLASEMTIRIHDEGKSSGGDLIKEGGYSEPYLKIRQSKYNRTADKKVILSLTRQLEDDWAVIATKRGYAIGWKNSFNYQKAEWMTSLFNKPIFSLSASEKSYASRRFQELFASLASGRTPQVTERYEGWELISNRK